MYTTVYNVREIMFSHQIGQFPTRSQQGDKYIIVMVGINMNAILVGSMNSRKDAKMIILHYYVLLILLRQAASVPSKHVLDNKVLENIKNIFKRRAN